MTPKEWRAEARLTSNLEETEPEPEGGLDPDRKFIVAVLADLKGHAGSDPKAAEVPLQRRRFLEIDRDNLDEIMGRLKPEWHGRLAEVPGLAESGEAVHIAFAELEDFHPDRIVQAVPALRRIHGLRGRLRDAAGMDEAESWLRECTQQCETEAKTPLPPPAPGVGSAGLLDSILGESAFRPAANATGDLEMQRFLRQIVEPHLVREDTGRQTALRSALDQVLSCLVNGILHDGAFRTLEATWRNLNWLARNVDTDSALKIWVLHLRKDEVLGDIMAGGDLEDSGMARLLLDPASVPGSERPSVLIGDYEFSQDLEDLAVLERLGNLGARLSAPLIAAASPRLFGGGAAGRLQSPADVRVLTQAGGYEPWRLLRKSAVARWVSLATPRLLCRLPYGRQWDPAETFGFEEGVAGMTHERFLWGSAAYAVAAVYATAFAEHGWQMNPATGVPRLDGYPVCVYEEAGEAVTKPCAEFLLNERVVEALIEAGLLPVVSHRDSDAISLPCLQAIAEPRAAIHL